MDLDIAPVQAVVPVREIEFGAPRAPRRPSTTVAPAESLGAPAAAQAPPFAPPPAAPVARPPRLAIAASALGSVNGGGEFARPPVTDLFSPTAGGSLTERVHQVLDLMQQIASAGDGGSKVPAAPAPLRAASSAPAPAISSAPHPLHGSTPLAEQDDVLGDSSAGVAPLVCAPGEGAGTSNDDGGGGGNTSGGNRRRRRARSTLMRQ